METPIKMKKHQNEKTRRERGNENRVKEERVKDGTPRVTEASRVPVPTPGTDDTVSGASPPQ
jgi:hypothetical protein